MFDGRGPPKTDEPRVQSNLELLEALKGMPYYVTEKIDGSSGTFGIWNGELKVRLVARLSVRGAGHRARRRRWAYCSREEDFCEDASVVDVLVVDKRSHELSTFIVVAFDWVAVGLIQRLGGALIESEV